MKIYQYTDYDDYVAAQTAGNKRKIDWVYVKEKCIKIIVKDYAGIPNNILCHGTRNGAEQKFFKKHWPNIYVIGSEISETANQFPDTVQHDFTKRKDVWVGQFDIIYSNSIDHSIDPNETLNVWKEQLTPTGKMYIEYSQQQSICDPIDPLEASNAEMLDMIKSKGFRIKQYPGKRSGHLIFACTQT
jgi:hypothetical protein